MMLKSSDSFYLYFKNVYDKILFNNLNYYIKVMKYKLLCYEL